MKNKCELIRDLLPLYIDKVCSEESKKIVEEHILECEDCNTLYKNMLIPTKVEESIAGKNFEDKQINSYKKINKKIKKNKRQAILIGVPLGILGAFIIYKVFTPVLIVIMLLIGTSTAKVETYTDVTDYEKYVGPKAISLYRNGFSNMFPEHINAATKVKDYQFTYYNPWDPQFVIYLTLEYNDEDYKNEIKRLSEYGIEEYISYYSVTGAPLGYEIIAMDSDSYNGFTYAMISEAKNTITYVCIDFCNYYLDLDIHEYIPDEYLLSGFDATINNPYKTEKLNNNN